MEPLPPGRTGRSGRSRAAGLTLPRELIIAWAGRHRRDAWSRLVAEYLRRIERWSPVREIVARTSVSAEAERRLEAEAEALCRALPEPCWIVALDRRGGMRSSAALAEHLERLREEWPHAIAFVLGSDLGLARSFLDAARERLSLGPMTLPHELARLVMAEQLYRALSIAAGIKYHRQPLQPD